MKKIILLFLIFGFIYPSFAYEFKSKPYRQKKTNTKKEWNFQKDKTYEPSGGRSPEAYKKILLRYVPENKITVGSPAQFRKWYNARQGEITLDDS